MIFLSWCDTQKGGYSCGDIATQFRARIRAWNLIENSSVARALALDIICFDVTRAPSQYAKGDGNTMCVKCQPKCIRIKLPDNTLVPVSFSRFELGELVILCA